MHRARLVGIMFLVVGIAALIALLTTPVWVPVPRIALAIGPAMALLGLAMAISPGPEPVGEGFDFEDWFDECSLKIRVVYCLSAFLGLGAGVYLYLFHGSVEADIGEFEDAIDEGPDGS